MIRVQHYCALSQAPRYFISSFDVILYGKETFRHNGVCRCLLWSPYVIGQTVIFLPCGFFFFFSSPNLSSPRLDVYHTSSHGVALVMVALWNRADHYIFILFLSSSLWSPYVIGRPYIFSCCGLFFFFFFFFFFFLA